MTSTSRGQQAFLFLFFLLLFTKFAAPQNFKTFQHSTIAASAVSHSRVATLPCECRQHCTGKCTGVSFQPQLPGPYLCSYTEQLATAASFGSLLKAAQGSTAYFRGQGCMNGFDLVEGVGCIKLFNTKMKAFEANSSCPSGSSLFTADMLSSFDKMRAHLLRLRENPTQGVDENIWVGLRRDESKQRTWRWTGGGTIREEQPSRYWGPNDPNNAPTICARLLYKTDDKYFYHLADGDCKSAYSYLCKQS